MLCLQCKVWTLSSGEFLPQLRLWVREQRVSRSLFEDSQETGLTSKQDLATDGQSLLIFSVFFWGQSQFFTLSEQRRYKPRHKKKLSKNPTRLKNEGITAAFAVWWSLTSPFHQVDMTKQRKVFPNICHTVVQKKLKHASYVILP